MKKLLLTAVAAALMLTACGSTAAMPETIKVQNAERNVITVAGSEEVKVVPDIADIIYGVRTEAADAAACQNQNVEDVNKVLELLKTLGIEEKSIQTSDFSLNPIYDWSGEKQQTVGFEMTTTITVSDLALDLVGKILSESVNAGINSIQSVTYKSSKYDESYQEALKLAIEAAKVKAEGMAKAGGCEIGAVVNITEVSNYSTARYATEESSNVAAKGMADMNVMPGEVSVEAEVVVDFNIK